MAPRAMKAVGSIMAWGLVSRSLRPLGSGDYRRAGVMSKPLYPAFLLCSYDRDLGASARRISLEVCDMAKSKAKSTSPFAGKWQIAAVSEWSEEDLNEG